MDDASGVQVAHALRDLPADVDDSVQVELFFALMKVRVQRMTLTVAGYNRQMRRLHAGAHKENQILMSSFSEHRNFGPKRFDGISVVQSVGHVEHLDRHVTVPVALEHGAEPSDADLLLVLDLVERYVPLAHGQRVLSGPRPITGLIVIGRDLRILRVQACGQTAIGG